MVTYTTKRDAIRLDVPPGVSVRWFDVASEDVDLKARVRAFNLGHFGFARAVA